MLGLLCVGTIGSSGPYCGVVIHPRRHMSLLTACIVPLGGRDVNKVTEKKKAQETRKRLQKRFVAHGAQVEESISHRGAEFAEMERGRDPVRARGGMRCGVPACGGRAAGPCWRPRTPWERM
jgi:hypothetical protein